MKNINSWPGSRLQASRWAVGTMEAKPTNLGPKKALTVSAAASVKLESLPPFRRVRGGLEGRGGCESESAV